MVKLSSNFLENFKAFDIQKWIISKSESETSFWKRLTMVANHVYSFLSSRINLLLLGLCLIPFLFKSTVETFLDSISTPVLKSLQDQEPFSSILLFTIFLITPLYYYHRFINNHRLSALKIWILFIATCWYLYFRMQGHWQYAEVPMLRIYYTDYLCWVLILNVAYLYFQKSNTEKKLKHDNNEAFFILDDAEHDNDLLGRKGYAKNIARTILNTLTSPNISLSKTFAIGITGEWGAGKSTFLNFIKKELPEDKVMKIDFNPWQMHSNTSLVLHFFDQIKGALGVYDAKLAFQMDQYVNQLTNIEDDNSYLKLINFFSKLVFGTKSVKQIFSEINQSIGILDKYIVVFIDDLDRLDKKEIVEVIKLIRISANFENTVFVVAYDKEYVLNAIDEFSKHKNDFFLEKIFLAEFLLPGFENVRLPDLFKEALSSRIHSKYCKELEADFDFENSKIFKKCITSIRDIRRFVNMFCLDFKQLDEEVLFIDFLNIELIKYKYHATYEFIKNEREEFLTDIVGDSSEYGGGLFEQINFLQIEEKELNRLVEEYRRNNIHVHEEIIKGIFSLQEEYDSPDRETEYLNTLNKLSIRRPSNFDTYFSLRLLEGKLGYKEFRVARQSNSLDFQKALKKWISQGFQKEIFDRLQSITMFDSNADYLNVLNIAFYFCEQVDDLKNIRCKNLIVDLLKNGNQYSSIKEDVAKCFDPVDYPFQINDLTKVSVLMEYRGWIRNGNSGYLFSEQDIVRLVKNILNHVLISKDAFPVGFWIIFRKCVYNEKVDNEIRELVLDFAQNKDSKGFFEEIIIADRKQFAFNGKLGKLLFPKEGDLINFTNSLKDSRLKELLLKFIDENTKVRGHPIDFDFENELTIYV